MTKKKILIVEDETIVAHDIKESLKNLDYEVTSLVSSGEEAIAQAKKDRPDLVLMDIVLQGKIDGIEAAKKINSQLNIPIIFLTAYSDEKTQIRARNSAPFGYVLKPFTSKDLEVSIDIALYRHSVECGLRHFNTVLMGLQNINELVAEEKHSEDFTQKVCDILTQPNLYRCAWIIFADESHEMFSCVGSGFGKKIQVIQERVESGIGVPCAEKACKKQDMVVSCDKESVCLGCPLIDMKIHGSVLTMCLEMAGTKYGVLSVLTSDDFIEDEREHALFKKIVKDVAQGLYSLDLQERHKDMTDAFEDSEKRYEVLVETIREGIGFFDSNGKIKFINSAFAENLGYPQYELEGRNLKDMMSNDDFFMFKSKILDKNDKTLSSIDIKLKTREGDVREFRVSASPHGSNGDQLSGTIAIMSDITESKKIEQRLQRSEVRSRRIIENNADGIVILDKKGLVRFVNPSAEQLFDQKAGDLVGTEFGFPMMSGKTSEIEIIRQGNGTATAEMRLVDMDWEGKEAYLATLRDITGRKMAAEKLEQSLEKLNKVLSKTIKAMSLICEARDPYTAGHQKRVTDLSIAIAREMGWSEDSIQGLRMAGEIHDIGKIYVPAEILSKPSQLNTHEFMLIKNHPQIGYDVLKEIEFPWPVAQIVYQHHERMDGSGYPNNLKGEDILPDAKILAVADVVEAMSSHRPYRPALGIKKALEEIFVNSGRLYDPEVVDICLNLFREKKFRFKEEKQRSSSSLSA